MILANNIKTSSGMAEMTAPLVADGPCAAGRRLSRLNNPEDRNICFASNEHRNFYNEQADRLNPDCYLKALIYTLGICDDTRRRFDSLYDVKHRCIAPEEINAEWQTGGSVKVTRLAFQLFTDTVPTARAYDDAINTVVEDFDECKRYSVSDIFCCGFAPYFTMAIKLRYPEYMRGVEKYADS